MAGGEGSRLKFLTRYNGYHQRAKPAVSVFGKYRIIDFVLSNLLNSSCDRVTVLLQYGAQPLSNYLSAGWGRTFTKLNYAFPQQGVLGNVFRGTADAVRQMTWQLQYEDSEVVGIWAGDHITKFDVNPFLQYHISGDSRFTIAVMPVPIQRAHQFGVLVVNDQGRVIDFQEKPGGKENPSEVPMPMPGRPDMVLASLGNYIVDKDYLIEVLDHFPESHDFGGDIIPAIIKEEVVYAFDMSSIKIPGDEDFFWEDVGSLSDYFTLHMQMLDPIPPVNLRNRKWPIRFLSDELDPARCIGQSNYIGPSSFSGGCQVEDSKLFFTFLGRECVINGSEVKESILFDNVTVNRGCDIYRTIVDKNVVIPPGTTIGRDYDHDERRGFYVDRANCLVIVPHYFKF
jgi:glucose-1-phosphate adenylyltransferase